MEQEQILIEEIIQTYLAENVDVPVYMEIPKKDFPSNFYVVEKTSGTEVNHIYNSTFAIKSYAASLYDAAMLNQILIYKMLYGLITLPEIIKVDLNSNYNFTDTQEKRYRYQAVFDIAHY